jgi:hypothetical protein
MKGRSKFKSFCIQMMSWPALEQEQYSDLVVERAGASVFILEKRHPTSPLCRIVLPANK